MKKKFNYNILPIMFWWLFVFSLFSGQEVFAQRLLPGIPALGSPADNATVQCGKTVQFTWSAPTTGATPFTYEVYIYNGTSWTAYSAGSNLYYNYLVPETGGGSLCGVGMQWYVRVTNAYGSTNSATRSFTPYPKFSGSSADYSITPSTSCQNAGTHSIAASEAKYYAFSATAGYTYYFGTCNTGMGCGTNTTWDTYLRIYGTNSSCTTSAYDDNSGSCGNNTSYIAWTCSTSGTYYVQVTGKTKFTYGTYYLQHKYTCPTLTSGSVGSNQSICYNTSPATFTQTAAPTGGTGSYTYQWQSTTVSGCGSGWGNISGATASTYQAPNLTQTTCYRRVVTSGACGSANSNAITVTVYGNLTSGSVGSNQSICYNTSPTLFTQTVAPSGGTGSYTYQWQSTTVGGCGSGWGNISGATASTYQAGNLTQTTCYRRVVTSGACGSANSNAITVTVYGNLTSGSVGSNQSICYNTSPALFTQTVAPSGGTGTYTYQWQSTTVSGCGSGWGNISGATASTYNYTGNLTQTTCYRRNVTSGTCGTVSSGAVTVTVYALPVADAGDDTTIYISDSVQIGSSPIGGNSYTWRPGASLNDSTVANPLALPLSNTTYVLTVESSTGCLNYDTVNVSVTGTDCYNAIEIISDTICNKHEFRFINNQPEYWFKFTATDSSGVIRLENPLLQPLSNNIDVYVYENQCNSLAQLYYFTNNDTLYFFYDSLQNNNIYYIKVINNQLQVIPSSICIIADVKSVGDIFEECDQFCIDNLIYNGDFEDSQVWENGFTSEYTEGTSTPPVPLWPCEAIITNQSSVLNYTNSNPNNWYAPLNHTTGTASGNYLIANGNSIDDWGTTFPGCVAYPPAPPLILWSQTITGPFTAGDVYYCRYWTTNLFATNAPFAPVNPPAMQLLINNQYQYLTNIPQAQHGYDWALPGQDEDWHQLCFEYEIPLGGLSSIKIDVVTGEHNFWGNDLAIDDIEFGKKWEPEITVSNPQNNCVGQTHTLTTSGGGTYLWSTNETTSSIIVNPNTTTTYSVTVTQDNGCTASSSVVVDVAPLCECDGIPIQDYTITSSTTFNANTLYHLSHDITIQGNVVLNDVSIRIDNSAPNNMINIFIPSNATLTLNHCHLFACTRMWEGITVSGSGRLIINNGTLIEDARNAVYTNNLTNPASNTLYINSSVFNKNYRGVYIKDYQATTAPYPFSITNTVFTCRDFYSYSDLVTWPRPQHTNSSFDISELTNTGALNENYSISGFGGALMLNLELSRTGIYLEDVGTIDAGMYVEADINGNDPTITNSVNIFDNIYFGIEAQNSNFTSTNNTFQNLISELPDSDENGYGIYARNASGGTAEYQMNVTGVNKFYDCTFGVAAIGYNDVIVIGTDMRSTQEAIPPYSLPNQGSIGIYAATPFCNAIDINENTITNIRNGIVFFGDADITGTEQIIGPVTIYGNTIQASLQGVTPEYEYTYFGIYAANIITYYTLPTLGLTGPIVISNNNLYNVHNGIYMQGWTYKEYDNYSGWYNRPHTSNNFVSLRKIEYPNSNNYSQFGIMHAFNLGSVVNDNIINGFGNDDVTWYGINMKVNLGLTQSYNVKVNCNEVNETGTGIRFTDIHGYTLFENNTMDDNQWGYVLNGASIGPQGNATNASGNIWTNFATGSYKTYTMNVSPGNTEPTNSILFVNTNDNTQFPQGAFNRNDQQNPNHTYSLNNGYLGATNNNQNSCGGSKQNNSNSIFTSASDTTLLNWFEKIALDSIQYAIFDIEQRISAKHRLYRLLKADPSLLTKSTILKNFYIAAQNSNMALLATTENQLSSGDYSNALPVSSTISPANPIEQNYADFYKAYLNYKQDSITITDSITLSNLANGCVQRDGFVVFQARALYSLIYHIFKNYSDDCIGLYQNKSNPYSNPELLNILPIDKENSDFEIYPNPSNGDLWLKYSGTNTNTNLEISIFDLSGRLLFSENINISGISKISTGLNNGSYLISISHMSNSLPDYKGKLLIIK